mmetsp:Transcript_20234/g.2716  ORF Transcript_20234/g.2716 Transcript_20234/m.2716 type:complete len:82 (-) Transcript_20234:67-312(-)
MLTIWDKNPNKEVKSPLNNNNNNNNNPPNKCKLPPNNNNKFNNPLCRVFLNNSEKNNLVNNLYDLYNYTHTPIYLIIHIYS